MSRAVSMVSLARNYLRDRRKLGVQMLVEGRELLNFAHFADRIRHHGAITQELALSWACTPRCSQITQAKRLNIVRRFAKYRLQFDAGTQIPRADILGPTTRRLTPHIYSSGETRQLLAAARTLRSKNGLRAATYETFLGLIAATGMRLSEAIRLRRNDVEFAANVITVRSTKYGKSREIPIHPSTSRALIRYVAIRDRAVPEADDDHFFLSARGVKLDGRTVEYTFARLRRQLGWVGRGSYPYPRIMDLRHSFICRRLLSWHRRAINVDNAILALATYVGHTGVSGTYWYLTAIPELMTVVSKRFKSHAVGADSK